MTKQRANAIRKLRYILLTASCFILLHTVSAQKQTITYDTTIGGWNAKVTMRADMNYTKDSVQGIVFIPGTGECGTDITKLLIYGPHYWMTKGWDGSVVTARGTEYPIIISLQPPSVNQRPTTLKTKIDDILKRYRIKRNSLHLTGISQGGWVVNVFATYKPSENDYSYYRMVRTIVNVQGVVPDDVFGSTLKYPMRFGNWAKVAGGKALWFEQANDGRKMAIGAQNMNDSVPGSATYFKTNFGAGKHSDFEKFYDPSAKWTMAAQPSIMTITGKEVNMNIYQWMLSQGDSDPVPNDPQPPANVPPVSKAGSDITIRLPENSVKLNGSATDADGTIASWLWSQTSGPSTAEITSPNTATTNVNKLVEGKYVFRLTVKDDKGASAYSELTVTVQKALDPVPDPGSGDGGEPRPPIYVGLGEYQCFIIDQQGKLWGLSSSKSAVGAGSSSGSAVPPVPVAVPSNLTFKAVASGLHHSLAVDNNGEVWCWGWNEAGQAGNGTASDVKIYTPQKITQDAYGNPFTNVVQVAAYYSYNKHSGNVALKADGTLWIWGNTGGGMLGDGTDGEIKTRPVRITIPGNRAIKKVVAAEVIVALATDGTVWSWGGGGNRTQNLGSGATDFRTPHQVVNLPTNIMDIAGASSFYYAVTTDGVPYGWGYFGVYLGIGDTYANNKPVRTPVNLSSYLNLPAPIKSIVCNTVSTHVILTDGTLWGWGDNAQGTIGNGEELDFMNYVDPYAWTFGPGQLMQARPVNIIPEINNFTHIFGGTAYVYYKYALTADGKLYSWGRNKGGVIGNGVVGGSSSVGASYPNAWDVPIATLVNPLGLKEATVQAASYCLLYPDATSCNTQKYTPGKPKVYAGEPQTIDLPRDSVLLSGNAVSPNGPIVGYTWKKISGPESVRFSTTERPTTAATGLTAGTYVFELTAKDYEGVTSTATVTVIVNGDGVPENKNPVAVIGNGSDITITLPDNSVTLDGSESRDEDGQIVSYTWKKTAGPATFAITSPSAAKTTVTGLNTAGTYTFELTVIDDKGASAKKSVNVIVKPAPNVPPVANAGSPKSITLPVSTTTLDGSSSTDADGTIVSYKWTKVSGPATFTIVAASQAKTEVNGLTTAGEYVFELTVTDDKNATATARVTVTVNPAVNVPPVADAGDDVSIALPENTVTLDASGSFDEDGQIVTYLWRKIAGPTTYSITDPNAVKTTATGLVEGTYVFEVRVTDNSNATSKASVTVIVGPAGNIPPHVNAGPDVTITHPTTSTELDGSRSKDSDGTIVKWEWTKKSGPDTYTIVNPNAAKTALNGLTTAGTYVFQLKVTDDRGGVSSESVNVFVKPAPNVAPVAHAGTNVTITLPTTTANLDGSGSKDSDGQIVSYVWAKKSGPATFLISSPNAAKTSVTGLTTAGTYVFELTVTDNNGASAKAEVSVTVKPANIPPVAHAGSNKTITLPTSTADLDGSGSSDADGQIVSYSWSKKSGPSTFSITSPNAAKTSVTGLTTTGTYVFELTVKDNNGATDAASVTVTVNPAPNVAPVAHAGSNKTITLPTSSTELDGSGSKDSDGQIVSYSWSKKSGPSTFSITSPNAAKTSVTGLTTAGTYVFELTVKDDRGATATASVTVTVNPAPNVAPVAKAGSQIVITQPASSTTLDGSGSTDADGQIVSYQWTKKSGPASFSITNPKAAKTSVTGLTTAGTYVFELTVTDDRGASANATVSVIVNMPPIAEAGNDFAVTLPAKSLALDGTGSYDPDGSIASYSWAKVSGPAAHAITSPNAAKTAVTSLETGVYVFELTVKDNRGAVAKDQVQVVVNGPVIPNVPPVANAGTDITVGLPTSYTELNGTRSTDSDGSIVSYKWRQLEGPAVAQIAQETSAVTTVSGLVEGIYRFELAVTDDKGATATSVVTVNVIVSDNRRYDEMFTIYPNPVQSVINLAYQSDRRDERLTVLISDVAGRVVIRKTYAKNGNGVFTASIDATSLKSGMYFIRLISGTSSKKPVYQKGFIKN